MGLIVHVYRSPLGDSTNGGVSSKALQLTLVNVSGPFEPDPSRPAAYLLPGRAGKTVRIVPAGENGTPETRWTMFGGNYAASSDGRFTDAIQRLTDSDFYGAVAIHDRIE